MLKKFFEGWFGTCLGFGLGFKLSHLLKFFEPGDLVISRPSLGFFDVLIPCNGTLWVEPVGPT